jgi:hypothetical protein
VRTLVHCVVKYSRPPDLKSSSNVSLPFAWITGPATDPSLLQQIILKETQDWLLASAVTAQINTIRDKKWGLSYFSGISKKTWRNLGIVGISNHYILSYVYCIQIYHVGNVKICSRELDLALVSNSIKDLFVLVVRKAKMLAKEMAVVLWFAKSMEFPN